MANDPHSKSKARFIPPQFGLKAKVGTGGLSDEVLEKIERMVDIYKPDFRPEAESHLEDLAYGIQCAKDYNETADHKALIKAIAVPCMQLKANGAMFKYPLVSDIAENLMMFLEDLEEVTEDLVELTEAFYRSLQIVIASEVTDANHPQGKELLKALEKACSRYIGRHTK